MAEQNAEGSDSDMEGLEDCEFQVIDELVSDDDEIEDREETGDEVYTCIHCGEKCVDLVALQIHGQQHIDGNIPTCVICSKRCTKMKQLRKHSRVHNDLKKRLCNFCSQVFNNEMAFIAHKNAHFKEIKCPKCKRLFNRVIGMFNHMKKCHYFLLEDGMTCRRCAVTLPLDWEFIEQHIQQTHKKDWANMCETPCNPLKYIHFVSKKAKWFNNTAPLVNDEDDDLEDLESQILDMVVPEQEPVAGTSHMKQEASDLLPCISVKTEPMSVKKEEECEFQTVDKSQKVPEDCKFEVADELVSDNEDPDQFEEKDHDYTCKYCGKSFLNLWPLQIHIRFHTGGRESTPTCIVCGKQFPQIGQLKDHSLSSHSTMKRKCFSCKKIFSNRLEYKAHKLTHKDFKCPICGHQLRQRNALLDHLRNKHPLLLQAGMKCRKCPDKFMYWKQLVSHVKKAHSQTIEIVDWFKTVPI